MLKSSRNTVYTVCARCKAAALDSSAPACPLMTSSHPVKSGTVYKDSSGHKNRSISKDIAASTVSSVDSKDSVRACLDQSVPSDGADDGARSVGETGMGVKVGVAGLADAPADGAADVRCGVGEISERFGTGGEG